MDRGRNLPDVVAAVVWARQLRGKVEAVLDACDSLLGDLPGGAAVLGPQALALHGDLTAYADDQVLLGLYICNSVLGLILRYFCPECLALCSRAV